MKAAKIVLLIVGGGVLIFGCCCGGPALFLVWQTTGDVEETMIGEWGGSSTPFGYTRRLKFDKDGTYEEDMVLTWHRKGTWKKISKTDNKVIIELNYTQHPRTNNTMEVTFRTRSSIDTKTGEEEITWQRDKWVGGVEAKK